MATAQRKQVSPVSSAPDRKVTPLYHQVYVALRRKIQNHELPVDQPLPGEHQLAEEYGVSRVTIRHTLKNLELDGFVTRVRGVGTFPLARKSDVPDRYNIGGLLEPGSLREAPAKVRAMSMEWVACPPHIARQLDSDARVLRLEKLRSIKREPFTVLTVYIPEHIAEMLDLKLLRNSPTLVVLEQSGFYLARAEQSISATAADDVAAELLRVPVGSPLIAMSALFTDATEQPLAVLEGQFRPELYEYKTSMLREGSGATARWKSLL